VGAYLAEISQEQYSTSVPFPLCGTFQRASSTKVAED
jgi:hypothetical protein